MFAKGLQLTAPSRRFRQYRARAGVVAQTKLPRSTAARGERPRESWRNFVHSRGRAVRFSMATRAQQYRSQEQLDNRANAASGSKTKKKIKKKNQAHNSDRQVDAAVLGVSGSGTATRNFAKRSNNKGGPALEISATGTPSRKSTRSSAGRVKQATNLARRKTRQVHSPQERAARAAARS